MDGSDLQFISCTQLRREFDECCDDNQKRIMIFDVRGAESYHRSHLCLDARYTKLIKLQVRVFNVDPDQFGFKCTAARIYESLEAEDDKRVFNLRKHANDAIIIEEDTNDLNKLRSPDSKVNRLIRALTKFDTKKDEKLQVPLKILEGGYLYWWMQYKHFTTNPEYNPDNPDGGERLNGRPSSTSVRLQPSAPPLAPSPTEIQYSHHNLPTKSPLSENGFGSNNNNSDPSSAVSSPNSTTRLSIKPPTINKPVPAIPKPNTNVPHTRPEPVVPPKPANIKLAPGTAVLITPNSLMPRPVLPRSHSSPSVAQADGDELDNATIQFDRLALNKMDRFGGASININNNHVTQPSTPPSVLVPSKPRVDRTLKPDQFKLKLDSIRAQINFGHSPEASDRSIPTGLQNLGNTCFMNSVIQCLAYIPTLVSYFCSYKSNGGYAYYEDINFDSKYGSQGVLTVEFGAVLEKLNSRRYKYIEPKSFRDAVTKHIGFCRDKQQDSHEFMMMLFDKIHHDLSRADQRSKQLQNGSGNPIIMPGVPPGHQFWLRHSEASNSTKISDMFEGIFMSTLICTACNEHSNTFEVFNCLSLPIPSQSRCHVRDCLRHFSKPEQIDAWECPKCKQRRSAVKKIVICKLPKILIIHLKRFSLADDGLRQKLQTTVDFPLTDLTVDCVNALPQAAYAHVDTRSSYNLFAVVNHYGTLEGGHYTAFCRMENRIWHTFNDSYVDRMRDVDVCKQDAYILFYATSL